MFDSTREWNHSNSIHCLVPQLVRRRRNQRLFSSKFVFRYPFLSSHLLSFSAWSTNRSFRTLIAYSSVSTFEVYLPADGDSLDLLIEIRDQRDCFTEWTNLSSITIRTDSTVLDDLMENLVNGSRTSNFFIELLTRGTQNQVGQLINSLSRQLTKMDEDNLQMAISSQFNCCSIFIELSF